jgi:hypothetical protein
MSDFDEMAPAALALAGVPFGEGDIEVLRAVAQAFEPAMRALDAADLAELPLEGDIDPSRPPGQAPTTQASS